MTFYTDAGQELECGQLPDKDYYSPGHGKNNYGRDAHLTNTADNPWWLLTLPMAANGTAAQNATDADNATATGTTRHTLRRPHGRHGRKHQDTNTKLGKAASRMLLEAEAIDRRRHSSANGYGVYESKRRYFNPSIKPAGRHYYSETSPAGPAKCSVDRAPHQPEWSGVPNWWSIKADDHKPFGMAGGR